MSFQGGLYHPNYLKKACWAGRAEICRNWRRCLQDARCELRTRCVADGDIEATEVPRGMRATGR